MRDTLSALVAECLEITVSTFLTSCVAVRES
jgi:hypothetical protein